MSIAAQPARRLTRDQALDAVHEGATLVTGNDRLARVLRQRYHQRREGAGRTVWPSPHIHSWGVWADRLWRDLVYRSAEALPVRLSAQQERLMWKRIIGLDSGRSNLLSVETTAEAAQEAWRLAIEWRLEPAALEACPTEDVQAFLAWGREFEAACARDGWIDGARAIEALIERGAVPAGSVLLAGFDQLTPQQTALVDAFRAAGTLVREVGPAERAGGDARRVKAESPRAEIRAAARWARRLVDDGVEGRIGVVVPRLVERRQEVERTFQEAFDAPSLLLGSGQESATFTISAGMPLSRYALVHAALLSLELQPAGTDLTIFGAWLRCGPVAGGELERNARGLLDRRLREKGAPRVALRRLGALLGETPALQKALRKWARRHDRLPERMTPAAWSEAFSGLLAALEWPGETLSIEGVQIVAKWNELLGTFASLGATADSWDLATARRTLERLARETTFQPETGAAPVEVMGLLDSAGADLDYLWVTGLDDETWPREQRPNPFLPAALQRARGLPHASVERELVFARRETERLLASAEHVIVSHACATDDRKLGPSPLILALSPIELETIVELRLESVEETIRASARFEEFTDAAAPPVQTGEKPSGGVRVFEYQAHCPFRAFAQLRLGAQPLRQTSPGLAPWERGLLVHDALEQIWKDLEDSRELHTRNPGALCQTVAKCVDHALAQLAEKRREPLPARFEAVERARLEDLLLEWLETEKTHRQNPFRVVESEQKREIEIGGVGALLRVDRVDELEDGRQVIVDYKTGKTTPKEWDRERSIEPQLPLYAVSQGPSLGGALFARLRATKLEFQGALGHGVSIKGGERHEPLQLEERVSRWRSNLEALAAAFLAGRAEVDPRDGKCRYCELPALCRKDEADDAC